MEFPQVFPVSTALGHPGVAHLAQRGAHGAQGAARAAPQGEPLGREPPLEDQKMAISGGKTYGKTMGIMVNNG